MYDKNDSPKVKAALLAAFLAAIAWHDELVRRYGYEPDALPESATEYLDGEHNYRQAIAALAERTGEEVGTVDANVRGNFIFYRHTLRMLHRDMNQACPEHRQVTDLCHGSFAELHYPFTVYMGMTNDQFLEFIVQVHQEQHPECPGFTATAEALAGCTTDGRRDCLVPWQ